MLCALFGLWCLTHATAISPNRDDYGTCIRTFDGRMVRVCASIDATGKLVEAQTRTCTVPPGGMGCP